MKDTSISNSEFTSNYTLYGGSGINSIVSVHKDATHIDINWCNLVFENNSAPIGAGAWIISYEYIKLLHSTESKLVKKNTTWINFAFEVDYDSFYLLIAM